MKRVVALAAVVVFARAGWGDIIVCKDGRLIDGKVISQDAKQVEVQSDPPATNPKKIESDRVLRVIKTDEHGGSVAEGVPGSAPMPWRARRWDVPAAPPAPAVPAKGPAGPSYYLVPLHGVVGETFLASALEQSLMDAAARKPTVVVLDIDSPGGGIDEAEEITKVLHHYNKQMRIVALTGRDLSAAAIVTLSVREIYVKPTSTIGAATAYQPSNLQLPAKLEEKMQSAWRAVARNSAQEGMHDGLLAEAMIDNDMEIHLEVADGKRAIKEGPGGPADKVLSRKGKILTMTSREAVECGLAAGVAEDIGELGQLLHYENWSECAGLGTVLAAYLPKKYEAFDREMKHIGADLEGNLQEVKRNDPSAGEYTTQLVMMPGPMMPGPVMPVAPRPIVPGRPYIPQPMMPGPMVPQRVVRQVVTPEVRAAWKDKSLACVVSLQKMEADVRDAISLCEAFGQNGSIAELKDALGDLESARSKIYDDRNKYADQVNVSASASGVSSVVIRTSAGLQVPAAQDFDLPQGMARTQQLGGPGGSPFKAVNLTGQKVIGVHYTMGEWGGHPIIRKLDPIYEKLPVRKEAEGETVVAKEGYIVGGMAVDSDVCVNAVQLVFVRVREGQVDSQDRYTSDWLGYTINSAQQTTLGGKGESVTGIYGRQGVNLDAVGLIVVPAKPAEKMPGK